MLYKYFSGSFWPYPSDDQAYLFSIFLQPSQFLMDPRTLGVFGDVFDTWMEAVRRSWRVQPQKLTTRTVMNPAIRSTRKDVRKSQVLNLNREKYGNIHRLCVSLPIQNTCQPTAGISDESHHYCIYPQTYQTIQNFKFIKSNIEK